MKAGSSAFKILRYSGADFFFKDFSNTQTAPCQKIRHSPRSLITVPRVELYGALERLSCIQRYTATTHFAQFGLGLLQQLRGYASSLPLRQHCHPAQVTFHFVNLRTTNGPRHFASIGHCNKQGHGSKSFFNRLYRQDRVRKCLPRITAFDRCKRRAQASQNAGSVRTSGPANRDHCSSSGRGSAIRSRCQSTRAQSCW